MTCTSITFTHSIQTLTQNIIKFMVRYRLKPKA